ncbi:helix-turn-helix domain-containing protein [Chryseobacterium bernardetii]|uniref:helix-turn-helix domain-containing protein n=1 Tax=Chryseobacterium bernardetii TaxID=1241978 RepID=UPI003017D1DD
MNDIIVTNSNNIKEIVKEALNEQTDKFANWFKSMMTTDENKPLTPKQAAAYLSMSPSTLHRHTKKGDLKAYGIGTRTYYNIKDIKSAMKPIN